jgi:hypothetical protein
MLDSGMGMDKGSGIPCHRDNTPHLLDQKRRPGDLGEIEKAT